MLIRISFLLFMSSCATRATYEMPCRWETLEKAEGLQSLGFAPSRNFGG